MSAPVGVGELTELASGGIEPRKGHYQYGVGIASVQTRGGTPGSLSLTYSQAMVESKDAQVSNRYPAGKGFMFDMPFVQVETDRVYMSDGSSARIDATSRNGLKGFASNTVKFEKLPAAQDLPARDGVAAQKYRFKLSHNNGDVEYYNADGNQVRFQDAFGNARDLVWGTGTSKHHLTEVVDPYGQKTTLKGWGSAKLTVEGPANVDGQRAMTTVDFVAGRVKTVTVADGGAGLKTELRYNGGTDFKKDLLNQVITPAGAVTDVTYLQHSSGAVHVDTAKTTGPGIVNAPTLYFSFDGTKTYAGPNGEDALFDGTDYSYRYTTVVRDNYTSVKNTFNKLGLLVKSESDDLTPSKAKRIVNLTYPGMNGLDAPKTNPLPLNYGNATKTETVHSKGSASRTEVTTAGYDDKGRPVESVDAAGSRTTTAYDDTFSVPVKSVTVGKGGEGNAPISITENQLSESKKTIVSSTMKVAEAGKKESQATARNTVNTKTNEKTGEVER
ncbi:hypothetical protein ACFWBC_37820, partial [Streptomyces sp. NPDC059985]|uniref:hypothetical protein n=1 Tax=Streptomyces sp. NPDC059985 TaxID=3347025 RepID=UPI003691A6A4